MRKVLCFLSFCMLTAFNAQASVVWDWSFDSSALLISSPREQSIPVQITVRNDISSTESLYGLQIFLPQDSLQDDKGRWFLLPTVLPSRELIAPGGAASFVALYLYPFDNAFLQENIASGKQIIFEPMLSVCTKSDLSVCLWSTPIKPMTITFSAVPEPSSTYLIALGLVALVLARSRFKQSR